jgi:hypothetical protein
MQYSIQNSGKVYSPQELVTLILDRRTDRYSVMKKHYNRIIPRTENSLYKTKFKVTMPDTLVFMREIKVLNIKNGLVEPLELSEKARSVMAEEKRLLILYYVLNSKYKAYQGFLKRLIDTDGFLLPKGIKRDEAATEFINKEGFATDIASFYAIRDLLYELDAINWYVDEQGIHIYPVMPIRRTLEDFLTLNVDSFDFHSIIEAFTIDNFVEKLVETYLEASSGRFMKTVDLVQIRDLFCRDQRMGDFQFKELLLNLLKYQDSQYNVFLSFGTIAKQSSNYNLKIASLPRLSSNRLALYVNIEEKRNNYG